MVLQYTPCSVDNWPIRQQNCVSCQSTVAKNKGILAMARGGAVGGYRYREKQKKIHLILISYNSIYYIFFFFFFLFI